MKVTDILEVAGNGTMYALTAMTTEKVMNYINLGLSILISIIIIVAKLVSWFKKSSKDGKIDKEELEELNDILKKGDKEE